MKSSANSRFERTHPYKAWTGKKPDVSHLREFGCDIWVLDETKNKSNLVPRSKKMVFVGFEDGPKAIRYWDKATKKIKVLRNVAFNENEELTDLDGEVPGISAEGENRENSASTPTPESQDTQVLITPTHVEPETRNL
jgi:hypothetical protein